MNTLKRDDWPGNIRQLQNAIFRAVVMCEGSELTPADFSQISPDGPSASPPARPSAAIMPQSYEGMLGMLGAGGKVRELADMEREIIRFAIDHHDGKMSEIARRLGIGRSTLYRKIAEYGLDGK